MTDKAKVPTPWQVERAEKELQKARLAAIFLQETTRIVDVGIHPDADPRGACTLYVKARIPGDVGLFTALSTEVPLRGEIE